MDKKNKSGNLRTKNIKRKSNNNGHNSVGGKQLKIQDSDVSLHKKLAESDSEAEEEKEEELAIEESDDEVDLVIKDDTEYFSKHFYKLPSIEVLTKILENPEETIKIPQKLPGFQKTRVVQHIRYKEDNFLDISKPIKLDDFGYFPTIMENFKFATKSQGLSEVESSLLQVMGRYCDLYYTSLANDYQNVYLLHIINHIQRNRFLIIKNIEKLKNAKEKGLQITDEMIDECRDQGFTRPRILIVVPYKKCVFEIVEKLKNLMFGERKSQFLKAKRFESFYGSQDCSYTPNPKNPNNVIRTEDYIYNMDGNIDDDFKIGITFSKKAIKLFTKFDESDMIIASPLGLTQALINAKEAGHYSFLSSIEIAVFDKMDIIQMQNWENVVTILNNLNTQPDDISYVDITRIRNVFLNNQAKAIRQTLMFSRYDSAEMKSAFIKSSYNYSGYITITEKSNGILNDIEVPVSQQINRIKITNPCEDQSVRFKFFVENIYPKLEKGTLIFIPSYYDFVQVKAHFVANNKRFAELNEYSPENKINSSKIQFSHGLKSVCLMTERFHYYNRYLIKGIKCLIFYQLPLNPHFFTQMINMSELETPLTTKIVFSDVDSIRLCNIYGNNMTKQLIKSEKNYHAMLSQ
ncbi:Digestive organ expansion factor homolog [Strongyloides ratti]|uniref:U3 small nucleolar RNA-associated protein 25 homolog n=1 Tax=Strongyloides ratti TaxID=34506 RepID=A0A090LE02_STRRB|nr:Digestive organ expansion factor homolog [Strongyloides ratti]CEF67992.1 Digestive organ expansion factor homolog [Strongyloides ratti]